MIPKSLIKFLLTIVSIDWSLGSLNSADETGNVASLRHQSNDSSVLLNEPLSGKKLVDTKSESAIHASKLNSSFLSATNYEEMLGGKTPADLETQNNSAEEFDSVEEDESTKAEFDGLMLAPNRMDTSESISPAKKNTIKNVYKVPRPGAKKTVKSAHLMQQSSRSDEQYFHVFASLFDHYAWSIPALETSLSRYKQCFKDVEKFLSQLRLSRDWAEKVSDASGKYRGLFFFENDYWLGSKQFCNEINNDYDVVTLQFFVLRAFVNLSPASNATHPRILHLGQCLPKSCTPENVATIMSNDPAFQTLNAMRPNTISFFETRTVPGSYDLWSEKKSFVFGLIFIATLLVVIWASIYENVLESKGFLFKEVEKDASEVSKQGKRKLKEIETCEMNHMNNNNNEINFDPDDDSFMKESQTLGFKEKVLLCFAYRSNSRVILSTKKSSKDSLTCIHGLRLFSLLWTIMVHTYLQVFAIGENKFNRKIAERTLIYQVVGNATYSVDTFFFIGGLLVVLLFLRTEQQKKLKKTIEDDKRGFFRRSVSKSCLMIFYRFLRLTPTYIIIIGFTAQTTKVFYNASVFTPGLADHVNCDNFWWRNVLYINNFYPLQDICMMWSWYLSNDFQFYVIAVLLLILSTRYFKIAMFSSGLLLSISWIVSIYMSITHKYTHKVADPFESFDFLYDKPWQRFGPYAMGMVTGYFLHRFKNKPPSISPFTNLFLWALSLLNLCVIVFGVTGGSLSILMTSLYVSLGHTAWGLSLCWITLSCCWNLARPVNSLLSYNGFLPMSRLTYCAYLIHPTLMMTVSFQFESPMHLKHGMVITAFFGNAALSFIVAFIISIMFEAPVIRLLKLCFRK